MATWAGPYNCTDCGKPMDQAGTCKECLAKNQPAANGGKNGRS